MQKSEEGGGREGGRRGEREGGRDVGLGIRRIVPEGVGWVKVGPSRFGDAFLRSRQSPACLLPCRA